MYAARRELYTVVGEIFRERRGRPAQHYDLLEMLLEARDEETGEGMMDQQVRDEVLTLLLAGHETTANALSWTFLLPAQHPHVEVRLQEEYQRVLNGHPAVIEDLPQLPYTRMVIEEAMRLYPPAWGLGRRALGNDVIDGYFIPKGAYVLLFPYVTHRHPAFWEQPDAFDPERFSAGQVAERPRFAYFPFGGGPRLCLGNQFALYEAQLILATILSRYQLQLLPGAVVTPEPLVTLRPRGDLLMTVRRTQEMMARDFKHPKFGVNIHTSVQPGVDPVTEARHAEQLGFDLVTLHGDVLHGSDPSSELWTLLSWVAASTSKIRVAPVVLALPNRHPAVLAKMAETLDRLSDGRLVLVLGAGGPMNEPAYQAFGLAQRSPREKVQALEEALDILRGLWNTSGFSYTGQHFRAEGATIEPKPSHPILLWLGVFGAQMLDLVGRKADGWLPTYQFLAPDQAYQKLERIRAVAEQAGRNPDEITYGYNVPILVEEGAVTNRWRVAGSAGKVATQLAAIVRHGFTFVNVWPVGEATIQRERLAREVLPAVRDLLA